MLEGNRILHERQQHQIDDLAQDCSNFIANTIELLQSYAMLLKCWK